MDVTKVLAPAVLAAAPDQASVSKVLGAAVLGGDAAQLSVAKVMAAVVLSLAPLRIISDCPIYIDSDVPLEGFSFEAEGGSGDYTWDLRDGVLPDGLTFHADGTITGTPTTPGVYPIRVRVSNA